MPFSWPSGAPPQLSFTMSTSQPRVWAVGDITQIAMANGTPFPKAGAFAEAQGRAAAAAIVADVTGSPPAETFNGKGYCFVETGDGKASAAGAILSLSEPNLEAARASLGFDREHRTILDHFQSFFPLKMPCLPLEFGLLQ